MLKKITNIVVIVLLVMSLTLFVSCGDKKAKKEAKEIEKLKQERAKKQQEKEKMKEEVVEEEAVTIEKESVKKYTGKKEYELQLAARRSRDRVEISKENFKKYGYSAKITTTYKNGEKFYRLRMQSLFTKEEAKDLGEKLKKQFPSVQNYWIQKIN